MVGALLPARPASSDLLVGGVRWGDGEEPEDHEGEQRGDPESVSPAGFGDRQEADSGNEAGTGRPSEQAGS
jgi:hypothetical protein